MSEVNEGFRIDTMEKAAWAMRKYRRLAQRLQQNQDMARREHNRIDAWQDRVNAPILSQLEFYEHHLTSFGMVQRAEGRKSLDFPDGSIKTRATGGTFDVDKVTFLEWAEREKRDDVLRVSLAPNLAAMKETFVVDSGRVIDPLSGEVVPGVLPVPEAVTVKFEPDMEAEDLQDEGEEDEFVD
jgi:hypothetical protein